MNFYIGNTEKDGSFDDLLSVFISGAALGDSSEVNLNSLPGQGGKSQNY